MSSSPSVARSHAQPRAKEANGLFARMVQAWLGHYQRLIDAGTHPV